MEVIEEQLTVTPAPPPQHQTTPEMGQNRRGKQSTKSDPRLRVRLNSPTLRDPFHTNPLQQFVRIHTAIMLGIKNLKRDPVPDPPSTEDIELFIETGRRGPSKLPGKWRPDLNGPRKSAWNKAAVRRFRRSFLKSGQYGDWTAEQVEKGIWVHMETLRARYRDQTGQRSKDERLLDNIRAARSSRVKSVGFQCSSHSQKIRIYRPPQLIQQRLTACAYDEDLSTCLPYIKKLAEEGGMSGDESDNRRAGKYKGQAKYFRVRPIWRAPAISSWLDLIDKVYVAYRFQQNHRATPGNWIRKRYDTNRVDANAQAVPGLPQNFYDKDWLKTLNRKQEKRLNMAPPVNLKHSRHIKR